MNDLIRLPLKALEYENQWSDPVDFEVDNETVCNVSLVDSERSDLLTEFSAAIAKQIQFPVNTAFLHGMGIIATAMTKSFSYFYGDSDDAAPVTLYVVTSQPPSTGKSGVNNFFVSPVRVAFVDFNKKQEIKRGKLNYKLKEIREALKGAVNENEVGSLLEDAAAIDEELADTPIYKHSVSNTTPEALENLSFTQKGTWSLVSDEAGSINVLIGNVYSDNKAPNADIVLQSWDGDWLSVNRITRAAGDGHVKGSIAVIAQDETISTILSAGARGNGISERFLLLRENHLLGKRDHSKSNPVPQILRAKYAQLINELVFSDDVTFKFSATSKKLVKDYKAQAEPYMGDCEKYSNNLLRGVVGKLDKNVMKMSCVLHVVENWKGGLKPTSINDSTVKWAIKLHKELIKLYIDAADSNGFIGEVSEIKCLKEQLIKFLEKKKFAITPTELKDYVKSKPIFKGRAKLASYISKTLIPKCIEYRLCSLYDKKIVINPRLR